MNAEDIIKKIPELKLEPKAQKDVVICYNIDGQWSPYNLTKGEKSKYSTYIYAEASKRGQRKIYGIYYEYIPEINSIVCMECVHDIRFPYNDIKRKWEINDMFFITSKKELIAKYAGEWTIFTEDLVKYLPFGLMLKSIDEPSLNMHSDEVNENLKDAFAPLFPVSYLSAGKTEIINKPDAVLNFLSHKEQKKRTGPKQAKIDELTSINLPEVSLPERAVIVGRNKRPAEVYLQITKVRENLCCLRYITRKVSSEKPLENVRIYVDGKDVIACKKNNHNEYVQMTLSAGKMNFSADVILPFEKSDLNGTTLQYFGSIFEEIPVEKQSICIWMFLQYPLMEKLYSINLKSHILSCMSDWHANPMESLAKYFGKINPKCKNVHKCLGVNKYQLNKYIKFLEKQKHYTLGADELLHVTKRVFGAEEIDSIDNASFDIVFDELAKSIDKIHNRVYSLVSITPLICRLYSTKTMLNLFPSIVNLVAESSSSRFYLSHREATFYYDYLCIVEKLGDTKNFRPNFDSIEEIRTMHDAATAVYNLKIEAYRKEAFEKQSKKWNSFVYEDKVFSVIAPEHPGEIANEGIALHHCVKSYIDRVTDGVTNIVFIRKTDELDKPFFTVEISNKGTIEQVHGFANRNADTEPGLEAFIKKWAHACKLKTSNFNKVR